MKVDVFCQVIDNYGDIGVCWRLARQLVAEHGCDVRLIVDDLAAFRVIAPTIDPGVARQVLLGAEVLAWGAAEAIVPHPVVIEAFACNPPTGYVQAMAAQRPMPVWINLEYLSAEAWVDQVHGMPSQHPRLPLTKYFFCPGFSAASGGLLRESQVYAGMPRRTAAAVPNEVHVFAFAYPHAPVRALIEAFASATASIHVTVAAPLAQSARHWQTASPVPQTEFDAVLAAFDFLIVRGEDSFVRAQWAAKPFLWHIYPTSDGAHLIKLDAWLDRYCAGLDARLSAAYCVASRAFNGAASDDATNAAYASLVQNLDTLTDHAVRWRDTLMQQKDLATRLAAFVNVHKR